MRVLILLSEKIRQLKLLSKEIVFLFGILEAIFVASIYISPNIFNITISLLLLLPLFYKWRILLLSMILVSISILIIFLTRQHLTAGYIDNNYSVIKRLGSGFVIKHDGQNVFVRQGNFFKGDIVHVRGLVQEITNYKDINIKQYYFSNNILNEIIFPKVNLIDRTDNIFSKIQIFINDSKFNYRSLVPMILFNQKNNRELYDSLISLNIVHLFVISGFHLGILYSIFNYLFKKVKYKEFISLIPVFAYTMLLNFSIPSLRASMFLLLVSINKLFLKNKFKNVMLLNFVLIISFLINPRSIYSFSFVMTFITTYAILIVSNIQFNHKWSKILIIWVVAYLSNLPITIYMNHYINIFGFVFSIGLTPFVLFVYSLTILLLPFKDFLNWLDYFIIKALNIFDHLSLKISINHFSIKYLYLIYGIVLSCNIILITWNLYTDQRAFLLKRKLKN